NDVFPHLVERADRPVYGRADDGRIGLRLLSELGDRLLAVVCERDVEEAAQLDLIEARACSLANDVDLPAHARRRHVVGSGRSHSRAGWDDRDDLGLAPGELENLRTARRNEDWRPRL